MKEKTIEMNVRNLFRKVRSDKDKEYYKSNKEVSKFLGREPSRISRYVSETYPKKMTPVTPDTFKDDKAPAKEIVLEGEKLTRGNKLLMFIIWAAKATKMKDSDTFLSSLMAWAGIRKADLMKVWRANGSPHGTMTFAAWKQYADNRWRQCSSTRYRYPQRGEQEDLFEFAEKHHDKLADIKELTKGNKVTKKEEAPEKPEEEYVPLEQFNRLARQVLELTKKLRKLRYDVDNPSPRFKRRETLCPLGFYPKSHIADAIRRVVNIGCGSRKGLSKAAAAKLTEYYVAFCEYHERYQMTARHTDMSMLPFAKSTGLISEQSLDKIPEKLAHEPMMHWQDDSRLMCVVSGQNLFTDGGTSTAHTKYYSVEGLARAINFLWSFVNYDLDNNVMEVARLPFWPEGGTKVGIDAYTYLDKLVTDRELLAMENEVWQTCCRAAKTKVVDETDPFGYSNSCYKWVNRTEDDDTEE